MALGRFETAFHGAETNRISVAYGRLGDGLIVDVGLVGAREVDEDKARLGDYELRVEFAHEVVGNHDPVFGVAADGNLFAAQVMLDFFSIGKLDDESRHI